MTFTFLFDLDGTLVLTDDIYFNVWKQILEKYNITLTDEIFKNYIQGNSDKSVLNTLLYDISIDINDLSSLKDTLFIENISSIKVLDGVYEILEQIKDNNYNCCIVTNCNKGVAEDL